MALKEITLGAIFCFLNLNYKEEQVWKINWWWEEKRVTLIKLTKWAKKNKYFNSLTLVKRYLVLTESTTEPTASTKAESEAPAESTKAETTDGTSLIGFDLDFHW